MSARAQDLTLLILACAAAAQMHPSAPRVQFGAMPPVDNRMTHDKLRHVGATQNEPLDQARDALGTLVKEAQLLLSAKEAYAKTLGTSADEIEAIVRPATNVAFRGLTENWNRGRAASLENRRLHAELLAQLDRLGPAWEKFARERSGEKDEM